MKTKEYEANNHFKINLAVCRPNINFNRDGQKHRGLNFIGTGIFVMLS